MIMEPFAVHEVIVRDPVDFAIDEFLRDGFDFFRRDSGIDAASFDHSVLQDHGTCCDDRVTADDGIIHHDRTHADQHVVFQAAAMYNCVVTDADIVADHDGCLLIGAMYDCSILYVHLVSYPYRVNIPTNHGIEPNAAVITHDNIPDYRGIGCDKAIVPECGRDTFDRKDDGHGRRFMNMGKFVNKCKTRQGFRRMNEFLRLDSLPSTSVKLTNFVDIMNQRELFLRHVAQTSPAPLAIEMVSAEGCLMWDSAGREYMDLISGISVCNMGHRHPRVVEAIKDQADKYLHLLVYGELVETPQVVYASTLVQHMPSPLDSVYFTNSGAEATEGAMKLAKRFTGKPEIVAFEQSYHGSTQGALSVMGDEYWRNAYRPLLPGIRHLHHNNIDQLELIGHDTACVIAETIQAERGVMAPDQAWMQALRKRCDETGALLILDEIQTGFGRTGTLWAFEQYGIVPDIVLLGKALGGGMPLGAFVASRDVMSTLTADPVLGHITTFGGHPVCCAAGLAAMHAMFDEGRINEVRSKEALFRSLLSHTIIRAIRTSGLLMAVEFESFDVNKRIIDHCLGKGLLTDWFLFAPQCLRMAPPLVMSEKEIRKACQIILEACDAQMV